MTCVHSNSSVAAPWPLAPSAAAMAHHQPHSGQAPWDSPAPPEHPANPAKRVRLEELAGTAGSMRLPSPRIDDDTTGALHQMHPSRMRIKKRSPEELMSHMVHRLLHPCNGQ